MHRAGETHDHASADEQKYAFTASHIFINTSRA